MVEVAVGRRVSELCRRRLHSSRAGNLLFSLFNLSGASFGASLAQVADVPA